MEQTAGSNSVLKDTVLMILIGRLLLPDVIPLIALVQLVLVVRRESLDVEQTVGSNSVLKDTALMILIGRPLLPSANRRKFEGSFYRPLSASELRGHTTIVVKNRAG